MLDALRMALALRQPGADFELVSHTDQGSQPRLNRSSQQCVCHVNVRTTGDGLCRPPPQRRGRAPARSAAPVEVA